MLYFTFPDLFFLFGYLLHSAIGVRHMWDMFEQLILNLGSRVGYKIIWLCFDLAGLISSRLFLVELLLFNILIGWVDAN